MLSGKASHNTPNPAMPVQSERMTGPLAAANRERVAKPTKILTNVTPLGPTERIPSAMNKNDPPNQARHDKKEPVRAVRQWRGGGEHELSSGFHKPVQASLQYKIMDLS